MQRTAPQSLSLGSLGLIHGTSNGWQPIVSALFRITDSSSRNAVSFSSARTTYRSPSSRYASAIQIVRRLESTADTQPQLQPALLRLSVTASEYFTRRILLLCSSRGNA